jgi:hypothetical protein
MQVWDEPNYQGRSQIFYQTGGYKLTVNGLSYKWRPGRFYETWQCSTATCFNVTEKNGWRGVTQRDWPGVKEGEPYGLEYLNIVCAENYNDPGCPGLAEAATYVSAAVVETLSSKASATPSFARAAATTTPA